MAVKVKDGCSPFIEQKGVVLCRSGIQLYHKSELQAFMKDNPPPTDKEWYREYRPANVVVRALDKCHNLPVTREHPSVWVSPDNFSTLAGGTTDKDVEVVALDGESEGEIGLKTDLTFYTDSLYDYYKDNKEVSLGYTCTKHWVDNPDEVGYDIILDEITDVNHLAITRAGRGGSSVAVIDSIIGGLKPMRTGLIAKIAGLFQKDSAPSSFGKEVLDAVKNSKGTTEEELAVEMKGVLDSCSILKDGEKKTVLMDAVRDSFDHKDEILGHEEAAVKELDSLFADAKAETEKGFEEKDSCTDPEDEPKKDEPKDSEAEPKKDEENDSGTVDPETKDSCDGAEPKKDDEKDSEADPKKDEEKDSEAEPEKKDDKACDSLPALKKEDIEQIVKDSLSEALKPMVEEAVKELLNIKEAKKAPVEGVVIDSAIKGAAVAGRDYSVFLEG